MDPATAFVEFAQAGGWIRPFDWPAWKSTDEAQALLADCSGATEEQLSRLITTFIRSDRFVEGTLLAAAADGTLDRIRRRAAQLRRG